MSITGIIILVVIVLVALLALRFLFGILRIIVIAILALLALALIYTFITGDDFLGITPTISAVLSTSETKFTEVTGMFSTAADRINQTASVAKEIGEFLPTNQESP